MQQHKLDDLTAFLRNSLQLADEELPVLGEWTNMANTIGAVALRSNILSLEQIEMILYVQEMEFPDDKFGEIAVKLGFLDHKTVERLLTLQELYAQLSLLGQLYLKDRLDLSETLDILSQLACQTSAEEIRQVAV